MSHKWSMDKDNVVHLHIGGLLKLLQNDFKKFEAKLIDLQKNIILSQATQTKKEKNGKYSLIRSH